MTVNGPVKSVAVYLKIGVTSYKIEVTRPDGDMINPMHAEVLERMITRAGHPQAGIGATGTS